jgi:glutamate-1-semialdehyde aminotransferase
VFALYLGDAAVTGVASARATDADGYRRVVRGLVDERVLLPQEPCSPAFLSNAHGAKDVDETLEAFERVLLKLHHEDLP